MITPITLLTIPLLVMLFLVELIYSYKEKKQLYRRKDTLSNLAVGIGYFAANLASKGILLYLFQVAYKLHLFELSNSWYMWILSFIAADFSYYWYHRGSHEINWFWAVHVVHHSSEEYNLSVAFRLPWLTNISGSFLFWVWMPLVGFEPTMTLISIQLCLFYQTFLHTETVKKLHPMIEYFLNTPSHHRVHHSSELRCLDKNHGGALIIWDRIFGTFRAEEGRTVYGLTQKLHSQNPITITFHEWNNMFRKMLHSGSIRNALNYLVQPPGWSHDASSKTVKQLRGE